MSDTDICLGCFKEKPKYGPCWYCDEEDAPPPKEESVVLEGVIAHEYNYPMIDGKELPLLEGESYRITISPLKEKQ